PSTWPFRQSLASRELLFKSPQGQVSFALDFALRTVARLRELPPPARHAVAVVLVGVTVDEAREANDTAGAQKARNRLPVGHPRRHVAVGAARLEQAERLVVRGRTGGRRAQLLDQPLRGELRGWYAADSGQHLGLEHGVRAMSLLNLFHTRRILTLQTGRRYSPSCRRGGTKWIQSSMSAAKMAFRRFGRATDAIGNARTTDSRAG